MNGKIIRIDTGSGAVLSEPVPAEFNTLGGRGMTSSLICKEVDPLCHPLDAGNKLIFAPGVISGTALSSSNRLSAGAKSPLTGGIKESNSGGVAAFKLARLGIRALILEGLPVDKHWRGLIIRNGETSFFDAQDLYGKGTYETSEILRERYGQGIGMLMIGPAGETGLSSAGINVNDREGEPCRLLGRGGLGAVMGSKFIKAVVIDDNGRDKTESPEELTGLIRKAAKLIKENPATGERFPKYGTAFTILRMNDMHGLPTYNYSQGTFPGAANINGIKIYELLTQRPNGNPTHACMPGCLIRCSNKFVDEKGNAVVGSLDFETLCLLGSNLGLGDLDQIAALNRICNDYGIDTMEIGASIGVAAEAGVVRFGDFPGIKRLLEEVGSGTPLGRIVGSGASVCGKVFGVSRVPVVKDQGMAAYDPRVVKGLGVTYATTPMGADHTAGNMITLPVDHTDKTGKVDLSRSYQINTMLMDILGFCVFSMGIYMQEGVLEEVIDILGKEKITRQDYLDLAKKVLALEIDFNRRAGMNKNRDRLPEFMYREPLPPDNRVFDISDSEIDQTFQDLG